MISKADIEHDIDVWVRDRIDEDFKFRTFQKERIIDIIYNIVNEKEHNQIIEAPTGSGKSLINIISAGVLADCYNKNSYILVSDLYLLEQYEQFIDSHKRMNFGAIRGQTGNYMCDVNGNDIRNADCRIAKIDWPKLFNRKTAISLGYKCACTCEYVHRRHKAVTARVTLMTYQLFMYLMNVVNTNSSHKSTWTTRNVLFCDECHNIPDIVQNQYSACITIKDIERIEEIYERMYDLELNLFSSVFDDEEDDSRETVYNVYKQKVQLHDKLMEIWTKLNFDTNTREQDTELLGQYISILQLFVAICEKFENEIAEKKRAHLSISQDEMEKFKLCSWLHNYMCFFGDFGTAISEAGPEYLIKQRNISNKDMHVTVVMNCIKEDYMCYKFLLSHQPYHVLTSATVGMKESFDENVGIKYTGENNDGTSDFVRVPSTFDFSRSPILIWNKFKMSYKTKATMFPNIINTTYKIVDTQFPGVKGLIQTGSYENARMIYNSAPENIKKRMLLYNDSGEKRKLINKHKVAKDSILIGPSLSEGIDLPDEGCRFIIIVKVPYPSLGNMLVKEKMKLFPLWYKSKTSNMIIQGIGRGNRNETDFCTTFILDGCFKDLYMSTEEQYSEEMKERMKFYN